MNGKRICFGIVVLFLTFLSQGCVQKESKQEDFKPSKQQRAEDAIKEWMLSNKEYSHYKPIVFGDLTPRYHRKSNRSLNLAIQIGEEEAISKETGDTKKLDSLRHEIEKDGGSILGYIIPHKFQETNLAGEVLSRELLFFLDTNLRVASALRPESFDHILDESVFYRLESEQSDTTDILD